MSPQKYTEAKKESNRRWDSDNLDRISVAAPSGSRDRWKEAAAARGKSLNRFIIDSVESEISNKTE